MKIKDYKFDENKSFVKTLKNVSVDGIVGSLILCCIFSLFGVYIEKCILDPFISFKSINYINFIFNFLEEVLLFYFIDYVINSLNKNKKIFTCTLEIEINALEKYNISYTNEKLEDVIKQIERIPKNIQKELYYICDSEISKLKTPILNKIGYQIIVGVSSFLIIHIIQIPFILLSVFLIIIAFIFNYLFYKKKQYEKKKVLLEESKRAILVLQNIIK